MSYPSARPTTPRRKPPLVAASTPMVNMPAPVVHVHIEPPAKAAKPPVHPLAGCALFGCVGLLAAPFGCVLVTLLFTVSGWVLTHHPAFTALWR